MLITNGFLIRKKKTYFFEHDRYWVKVEKVIEIEKERKEKLQYFCCFVVEIIIEFQILKEDEEKKYGILFSNMLQYLKRLKKTA